MLWDLPSALDLSLQHIFSPDHHIVDHAIMHLAHLKVSPDHLFLRLRHAKGHLPRHRSLSKSRKDRVFMLGDGRVDRHVSDRISHHLLVIVAKR